MASAAVKMRSASSSDISMPNSSSIAITNCTRLIRCVFIHVKPVYLHNRQAVKTQILLEVGSILHFLRIHTLEVRQDVENALLDHILRQGLCSYNLFSEIKYLNKNPERTSTIPSSQNLRSGRCGCKISEVRGGCSQEHCASMQLRCSEQANSCKMDKRSRCMAQKTFRFLSGGALLNQRSLVCSWL